MSTINISLPKGMVEKIDRIVKEQRYASRSELVRDALRGFFSEVDWASRLAGMALAVVTMTFNMERRGGGLRGDQSATTQVRTYNLNDISHLGKSCLEVILTRGDINEIKRFTDNLKVIRGIEIVKITVA
ncbi:CopG family ribbon-helix-helix protein [Candidatus Bathyarchaeota archaeon]|nr:CopG family ribbon-helix-helix protein [Candidatus Bathyarchaeota archaeon]